MTEKMSDLSPMVFDPLIVPKPWGGRRLEDFGKDLPAEGLFGESWELADLPVEAVTSSPITRSSVSGGRSAGSTLRALITRHGQDLLGSALPTPDGDFPLLVKYLDARENLSVQVHPGADYVATHPGTWLKTESWYVVDCDPGAVLYIGFRPGVTTDDVRVRAGTAEVVELLQPITAHPGDFHHLPAGIVHALGAGVMVAEPQTPSDTTFRLYDWTEEYGREPRPLHLEEALDALDVRPEGAISLSPLTGFDDRVLVETPHYWIDEHRSDGRVALRDGNELRIVQVVRGTATVSAVGERLELGVGSTALIPAVCAGDAVVSAVDDSTVLEIGIC